MISATPAARRLAQQRREAKSWAADAIRQALAGHTVVAEESWAKAKEAAGIACALQAYVNGFRHGRQAEREGSR